LRSVFAEVRSVVKSRQRAHQAIGRHRAAAAGQPVLRIRRLGKLDRRLLDKRSLDAPTTPTPLRGRGGRCDGGDYERNGCSQWRRLPSLGVTSSAGSSDETSGSVTAGGLSRAVPRGASIVPIGGSLGGPPTRWSGTQRDREAGEHYGALRVGTSMQSEPN
jgi:hypothetical protein